jgi:hypothetical protein
VRRGATGSYRAAYNVFLSALYDTEQTKLQVATKLRFSQINLPCKEMRARGGDAAGLLLTNARVVRASPKARLPHAEERLPMTDMYVYYFRRCGPHGENILSKRRATLQAINGRGEAVMESQMVVDHTEVDGNGFLIGGIGDESHPMDELWAQIRSLERRANSREGEALKLDESTEGDHKYFLKLESRELRKQAQILRRQRADAMANEPGKQIDAQVFVQFGGTPTTG